MKIRICIAVTWFLAVMCSLALHAQRDAAAINPFPLSLEFYETPDGGEPDEATVHSLLEYGVSRIWVRNIDSPQARAMVEYAQSVGMKVELMSHGYELFNRLSVPEISVYDQRYPQAVRESMKKGLADTKRIGNLGYVFPFQDEPFHIKEFLDYSAPTQEEFRRRYGYPMPGSFEQACLNPKTQLDFLNFQARVFSDGWEKSYGIIKQLDPKLQVAITHDSHNVYGSGVGSNSRMAIDDVFHWGGNYADLFVYDIYPYLTFDYRYGEMGRIRKPRMSQLHYTMAQMRNMTTSYGKQMGFWVGTYNPAWFVRFRGGEREAQYWSEAEIAYTAIAGGCDYLISPSAFSGNNTPVDSTHWQSYGLAMRTVQKEGAAILESRKMKASACFLFPRTQYLLCQEEYYNVGVAYELFLRAFGELDILHEEQITDSSLNGYKALVMCDVKLLPQAVASHIARFVEQGGVVIADCVPQTDENLGPLHSMKSLFGVDSAGTGRIRRAGQWVPFVNLPEKMSFPADDGIENSPACFDRAMGTSLGGHYYDFKVTSPRVIETADGKVLLRMLSENPALVSKRTGKGTAYLFGFCMQDTYFQTWQQYDTYSRDRLSALVTAVFEDSGVRSHVHCSNPDIEAGLRVGEGQAFLFMINHETAVAAAEVTVSDIGFRIVRIVDVESGRDVAFTTRPSGVVLSAETPFATTRLLKMTARKPEK